MKKKFCIICVLVMVLSLVGCISTVSNPSSTTDIGTTTDATQPANISSSATQDSNAAESTQESGNISEVDFDELTVVDNDACIIKITGIEPDNFWGYTLKVYLENKSAETTYMFSVTAASINGVESDPLFATEVAAGKKANEEINFTDTDLEDIIGIYTDIALTFKVHDSDDWLADPVAKTTAHVLSLWRR